MQFHEPSENNSGRLKRRTKECESMCYSRIMTNEPASECGRPLRIGNRKRSVRSEGMGADEIGGRDEREVNARVRGKQNRQKRLVSKKTDIRSVVRRQHGKISNHK